MGQRPRKDLLEARKKAAAEREEAWNNLSAKEKLDALDQRLGKGIGATKQRLKLHRLIESAQ